MSAPVPGTPDPAGATPPPSPEDERIAQVAAVATQETLKALGAKVGSDGKLILPPTSPAPGSPEEQKQMDDLALQFDNLVELVHSAGLTTVPNCRLAVETLEALAAKLGISKKKIKAAKALSTAPAADPSKSGSTASGKFKGIRDKATNLILGPKTQPPSES